MERTFVALDGMNREEVYTLLKDYPQIKLVKIGLELYLKYGNEIVKEISRNFNVDIFLDLKLHDIPNTVSKAIASLEGLPIKFLTVHASGGKEMLSCAHKSAKKLLPYCQLLAVTILTSHGEDEIKNIWGRDYETSLKALLTEITQAGIEGLVCSGQDLEIVRSHEKNEKIKLIKVTPGIRLKSDNNNDQKRVMSPDEAMDAGSNYLVVGRSITANPTSILKDLYP